MLGLGLSITRGGVAPFSPASIFANSEEGIWLDPSDLTTLFTDTAGTTPVSAPGQTVALALDKSKGLTGLAGMYRGLDLTPDYWIDAAGGDDGNAGTSEGAAWASLSKLETDLSDPAGSQIIVRIKAGNYDSASDHFDIAGWSLNSSLVLVFEPGCIMDGTAISATTNQSGMYLGDNGSFSVAVYGNGLTIRNYNYTTGGASPQGIGWGGSGVSISVYDTTVELNIDGISGHQSGHADFYDCVIQNNAKQQVANVSASTMNAYRCQFVGNGVETATFMTDNNGIGRQYFENCILDGGATTSKILELNNAVYVNCQIGTVGRAIRFVHNSTLAITCDFMDSFVNVDTEGWGGISFLRCFGKMSARLRAHAGLFSVEHCVFSGPATGKTNVIYANFDAGSLGQVFVNDNIFETATAAAFMAVDGTNAGYLVAAGAEFFNNILSGSAAFDADLIAADTGGTVIVDNVTADALIGAANTLDPDDYGYGAGSPAIGAATDGGNSGFAIGEIAALTPQQVRGPDGIPGVHAIQATGAAQPAYQVTSGVANLVDDGGDALNWTAPADDYTVAYVNTSGTVTILTSQALSGATDVLQVSPLVGYLAVNRALTTAETASLTAYFEGLAA